MWRLSGVEGGGGSDSRLPSITGRKDKTLLSPCQHSSAQRDFIDQRTAMQEPLLHPSDTIYHAPSSPPSCAVFFSPRRLSERPVMQRDKNRPQENLPHSGANHRGLNAKPVTFLQDITNGLFPLLQRQQAEVWWCNMD